MVATNFPRALAKTLGFEGGNDDDPRDPGGRTSRGITQSEYDVWRAARALPKRDVWTATDSEVASIYSGEYWDKVHGDELPAGIDFTTFDGGVNSGNGTSGKWLQGGLNDCGAKVTVDGGIGPETLKAANGAPDKAAVIRAACNRRLTFLHSLRTWVTFGGGWGARVAGTEAFGIQLDLEGRGATPGQVKGELGKAASKADASATQATTAATTAGGAVVATGTSATATPWWDGVPVWAIVAGVAVIIVVALYAAHKAQKHGQRATAYAAAAAAITVSPVATPGA